MCQRNPNAIIVLTAWACLLTATASVQPGASADANEAADAQSGEVAGAPAGDPELQAKVYLDLARLYLKSADYKVAQSEVQAGLKVAPLDSPVRLELKALLNDVLTAAAKSSADAAKSSADAAKFRQTAMLDEAERLLDDGKFAAASTIITDVLKEAEAKEVKARASSLFARTHPNLAVQLRQWLLASLSTVGSWTANVIFAVLGLILAYFLVAGGRAFYHKYISKADPSAWTIDEINDATGLGVRELIISSFHLWNEQQPAATAGLLKLEGAELSPLAITIRPDQKIDFASALQGLPPIGTVSPGELAKAWTAACRWFRLRPPWIRGTVTLDKQDVVVQLTRRTRGGRVEVVTASRPNQPLTLAAQQAAESASYMMHFLIANDLSLSDAKAADQLREGLKLLAQYLAGVDPAKLGEALKVFEGVRGLRPDHDEAHLCEGMALDLMERHDDAIRHFVFVQQHARDQKLKEKAIYNEAIARFRKYRPDELTRAIELLDSKLIGEQPDFKRVPIKALALAAKANAIAHRPIFWDTQPRTDNPDEKLARKDAALLTVRGWLQEVEDIVDRLNHEIGELDPSDCNNGWDNLSLLQLRWALRNARGNVYLNCATSILDTPYLPEPWGPEKRAEFLKIALEEFRNCEILLAPGVETLTNLANTLLQLGELSKAREYATRAIELNPDYEYGYYRLAEAWQLANRKDKVVEVLKSFKKTPKIRKFLHLYHEFFVEPAEG